MESIFCQWVDHGEEWVCSQCGGRVLTSAVPKKPFSACRVGAEKNGVAFRSIAQAVPFRQRQNMTEGPGTELKKLLAWLGMKATPDCQCNSRAIQMNMWGADECERRIDQIVAWLGEEAARRRLPFVEVLATKLVQKAILNARKTLDSAVSGDD